MLDTSKIRRILEMALNCYVFYESDELEKLVQLELNKFIIEIRKALGEYIALLVLCFLIVRWY